MSPEEYAEKIVQTKSEPNGNFRVVLYQNPEDTERPEPTVTPMVLAQSLDQGQAHVAAQVARTLVAYGMRSTHEVRKVSHLTARAAVNKFRAKHVLLVTAILQEMDRAWGEKPKLEVVREAEGG
jgi:hypothetical protein